MNFKRTQTWPGKTHSIIQRSAWGPKSLCIYINQCIVNFNWPMSCARAFLRNNWLPHFRLLLSSPSLSIQNMMTRAMIHPHYKIDEKWILTFLYIYRWNIDLKEKITQHFGLLQTHHCYFEPPHLHNNDSWPLRRSWTRTRTPGVGDPWGGPCAGHWVGDRGWLGVGCQNRK